MQILPPTVAAFQILNEARRALQQARISGAATHSRGASKRLELGDAQVALDVEPGGRGLQRGPAEMAEIDQRVGLGFGSENSHVPPASQAKPLRHSAISAGEVGWRSAVTVSRLMAGFPTGYGRSSSEAGPVPGVIRVGH